MPPRIQPAALFLALKTENIDFFNDFLIFYAFFPCQP